MSAGILIKDNLRAWLRARGFWLIVIAALVPPLLTGAWVATHQDDLAADDITHDGDGIEDQEAVNITATIKNEFDHAVGSFNATLRVGFFTERQDGTLDFTSRESETFRIEGLAAKASTTVRMPWTAEAGTFIFQIIVDTEDEIKEIEERNNDRHLQVRVAFPEGRLEDRAENLTGDLRIVETRWSPEDIYQNDEATITARVRNTGTTDVQNATVIFRVHQALGVGGTGNVIYGNANPNLSERIDLAAGEEKEVQFAWTPRQIAGYALVTRITTDAAGVATSDELVQYTVVDRQFLYEAPEEKATAKDFYRDVLSLLHLRLLIPLIALFYAGSVLEDERERGHLPYLLTRPVPRWLIPVSRFVTTFAVAGLALLVGVIATMIVLLGAPGGSPGYFYWPVVFTVVALLVYASVFTLLGVTTRRPYLVGLLYVIGFEALILIGQAILVNGRPLLQDWVLNLSLNHWVQQAFEGWDPTLGAQWLPATDAARRAMWIILGIAAASLAGAAWWMQRREFEDA